MALVMVIEDEEALALLLKYNLEKEGFDVVWESSGNRALAAVEKYCPSVILLDWMLPELSGVEICKMIRNKPDIKDIPIIMLTAKGEEEDKIKGLSAGADDYVTKPFSPAVLVKRVEALIKRSDGKVLAEDEVKKGLYIDSNAFVAYVDGNALELTLKEFELLSYLFENSGRVLTRDQLLNAIWGYDYLGDSRTVDSHIARLRTKLGDYGAAHLKTIYGMGYKLEA